MHPQDAMLLLQRLDKLTVRLISIEPTGCPLTPEKVLRDKAGNILFKYVDRLEYMRWLKNSHNLIHKGGNLALHRKS